MQGVQYQQRQVESSVQNYGSAQEVPQQNPIAELEAIRSEYEQYNRFQQDLEFVNMLANPFYLKYYDYLANNNFRNYLQYLKYFKQPEYFKFVKYPLGVKMLELLEKDGFVEQLSGTNSAGFADMLATQISIHKLFVDKLAEEKQLGEPPASN